MSNGSWTAFLTWAILASLFLAFFLYHLWRFDRLQCIKWNAGRQPGAFRRLMIYSYLGSTPMLMAFGVGITTLKFKEGVVVISENEVFPKPADLWSEGHQHTLLALFFVFSVAWALEQISHFEELAFWFFLIDQGPEKRDWFTSWEYKFWSLASAATIIGMPLTTMLARNDIVTTDAWIFLVGSSTSTATNLLFISILVRFPVFLRHVIAEGADPVVVIRLATFYELNFARIVFRFFAAIPLLVLAIDGVRSSHPINDNLFWSDTFLMISCIGQFISSLITVMVFFPRSITRESGYMPRLASVTSTALLTQTHSHVYLTPELAQSPTPMQIPPMHRRSLLDSPKRISHDRESSPPPSSSDHAHTHSSPDIGVEFARPSDLRRHTLPGPILHPFVTTYMSPIDLIDMRPNNSL
ncbi:hypothetical protein BGY98DRAFT_499790 [Russula aff. rugulosa BPL654]|nr:hypothetical protein BGY98DRAFT_499790 [Russula aff. rugulosa BPL654]